MDTIVKYAFEILLGIAGFFAIRTLNKIDKNQDKISERLDSVDTRLTVLETEHELIGRKGHCIKE